MTRLAPVALALVVAVLVTVTLYAQTGAADTPTITYLAACGTMWGALAGWLLRRLVPALRPRSTDGNGASE
ncbi:hypothetical protein ACFVVA_37045 [Kitasatospora sp. NPDC058048]|uniref:hypothetical protein n=1 Tax=Kitasatospora sp. NPDC058048 TaxID=3346313 RepID=UPI0036DD6997